MYHLSIMAFISLNLWPSLYNLYISSFMGMAPINLNTATKNMFQKITFLDTELQVQKSVHLQRTVLAESTPRALVAVQLKLPRAVCTLKTFKYCLSQGTFRSSQPLHEMEGFGFPSTWQISDAVSPRSTKNLFASVTLGETARSSEKKQNQQTD